LDGWTWLTYHRARPVVSVCPRCANPRDRREGPFYVCVDCHWCWTVSITGRVYVQTTWPRREPELEDHAASARTRRLLASIDGLATRLDWPVAGRPAEQRLREAGFTEHEIARLAMHRAATEADYFNEGVPLSKLRDEGVWLPPTKDAEPDPENVRREPRPSP